jgi:hypothetical protein
MLAPTKLSTDPIGEGAGVDSAVPGGRLEDLLELGLKGTAVPLRTCLEPSNDICAEITHKNLCHWPPLSASEMIALSSAYRCEPRRGVEMVATVLPPGVYQIGDV